MKNKLLSIEKELLSNPKIERVPMLLKIRENMPAAADFNDDYKKEEKADKLMKKTLSEKYPVITKFMKKHKVGWLDISYKKLFKISNLTPEEGQLLTNEFGIMMTTNLKNWGLKDVISNMKVEFTYEKQ